MLLKKKRLLIILSILGPILAYLFWPLKSADFKIEEDLHALEEKRTILNSIRSSQDTNKPNIILITVDDLGMADVSLYGEGDMSTPNIDQLGEQGVIFENAYVTSPVCAPSRAALITERYQHRFGFEFTMHERYLKNRLEYLGFRYFVNSHPWEAKWMAKVPDEDNIHNQGLPRSEITIADVLKKQGYQTGVIGKWHLGWSEEKRPSVFGFDEQYGFFNSHSLYTPEGTDGIIDQKIEGDWTDPYIWSGQRNGSHAIYRNYVAIVEKEYLTDRITDESIAFINNHKEEPFFLWASYNAPHTPLQAPKEYVDKFKHIEDPVKRVYRAMISKLDDEIGRFMKYLSDNYLEKNTIIFFISDNGGAEYTLTTDNGRYDGGKNTEFEGGIKVPMIIRWTGTIPARQRFESMVSSMDIFPTSIASVDPEIEIGRAVDGENLMPYLIDSLQENPHNYLFWQRGISKVVQSNEWKLMMNDKSGEKLLYNLITNKYENPEESAKYPEIVQGLEKEYKNWLQVHKEPLWPPVIYFSTEKDGKKYSFEQ
jgi:arylsulfatase A-like enzyme